MAYTTEIQFFHKSGGWTFSSVQLLSCVWLFATPWTAACQASLSITNSQSPPKPMSIESVMPSNHLILCCSLLLLPSIFPSIRVFSNESALCIRWPKYWSFSFKIKRRKWNRNSVKFSSVPQSCPTLCDPFQWITRADLLYDGLIGSPCSPRDSQESSPAPQFKSINSIWDQSVSRVGFSRRLSPWLAGDCLHVHMAFFLYVYLCLNLLFL